MTKCTAVGTFTGITPINCIVNFLENYLQRFNKITNKDKDVNGKEKVRCDLTGTEDLQNKGETDESKTAKEQIDDHNNCEHENSNNSAKKKSKKESQKKQTEQKKGTLRWENHSHCIYLTVDLLFEVGFITLIYVRNCLVFVCVHRETSTGIIMFILNTSSYTAKLDRIVRSSEFRERRGDEKHHNET